MSTYEISKSSLLSLKAEILRKQQELVKAKADNDVKIKLIKKNTPLEIKNKGIEARQSKDLEEVDEDLLKQSRAVLEAKTKLYDKLSSGKLTKEERERKGRFLVRFDKKNKSRLNDLPPSDSDDEPDKYTESDDEHQYQSDDDANKDPGEKWVDYIDCLGRTRKCLQKDLAYLMSKDEDLKKTVEAKNRNEQLNEEVVPENNDEVKDIQDNDENKTKNPQESELLSSDMRRELLREQWEKEEEELRQKSNIHYQDVLFGEARTHGVGYYGFSKDEEERAKQQEALKKLRQETEQKQKKAQELKAMREKQLAARIKAAKDRKRARLGLPPEEEPELIVEKEVPEEEKKKQEDLERKKEECEKMLDEARKHHVRPWDIGKEGVKEHYEMSQEEWVDKQRKERPEEFAPPSSYRKEFRSTVENSEIEDMDKSLNFTTKKTKLKKKLQHKMSLNPYKSATPDPQLYESEESETTYKNTLFYKHKDDKIIDFQQIRKNPTQITVTNSSSKEIDFEDNLLNDYKNAMQRLEGTDKSLNFTTIKQDKKKSQHRKNLNPYKIDSDCELNESNTSNKIYNEHKYMSSDIPYEKDFENVRQNLLIHPTPIINLCEEETDFEDRLLRDYSESIQKANEDTNNAYSEVSHTINESRGRGIEIAPPPSFEYYGPSYHKRPKISQKAGNIGDSIEAGLKFLRKQVEEKQKSTKHPREMFLS